MSNTIIKKTDKIKILYVDDNLVHIQLFLIILGNEFDAITADFGQIGLEILKNNKDIDVVISDFNMPSMNGMEFIAEARKINNDIPYCLCSGSLETDEIREALENKLIVYFFEKPLDKSQLLDEIYNYFDYRREQT